MLDLWVVFLYDVTIIGGGVSGLAAAMYSGRLRMKTLLLGDSIGGTIALTDRVENYPGFKSISGGELAEKMREHAQEYEVELKEEKVTSVEKHSGCFRVSTDANETYETRALIFATGTRHRELGVPGEAEFKNSGVHYCALCDGAIYRGKVVAVVGGSDSAAKEALLLSNYARKVYIIYRGAKIRPEPVNAKRIEEDPKIEVITSTKIVEIKGGAKVNRVVLDREYSGSKELALDAVFVAIGGVPLSELAKSIGVTINQKGEIKIDREGKTNVAGVFAAGDVTDTNFKQAIIGSAEGVTAAYSAYKYVTNEKVFPCSSDENSRGD